MGIAARNCRKQPRIRICCCTNVGIGGCGGGICTQLGPLPSTFRQTITFDRGTEFAAFRRLRTELGMESYFCDPKAPWQKGGVENFNGRLRRYLPSDTDIAARWTRWRSRRSVTS
ncbi:IS30 family transposase (plasmid) [Novosphingobium sp. BL-8A]|uniref:IS30 family transposase n=1 Tax=Novosphingobium sp. BL-8A TaxID=3127639 RepID=UPI0037577EB8